MMSVCRIAILMLGLLLSMIWVAGTLAAEASDLQFDSVDQERRYRDLITELRCLVCQNQSLADSDAELAQEVLSLLRYDRDAAGKRDFLGV